MRDELGVVAKRRGYVAKCGVVVTSVELPPSLVLLPSVSEFGVIVNECAPSGVASLLRLASSPEHGVVIAEHAPSGVVLPPSGMVLLPKRGVVFIIATIDDGATTKGCLVGVGSASRGDSKREQVPPGRQSEWPGALSSMVGKA